MAEQTIFDKLTNIANAIRTKTGGTETLSLEEMSTELNGIPNNDSSDLTVSGPEVTVPAGHYKDGASKSVATATQATPSVSINTTNHTATASVTQSTGYVTEGTKTASATIPTETKSATPKTTSQSITPTSGKYLTKVTINAIPSNYADTTTLTATTGTNTNPSHVLEGKQFIGKAGTIEEGEMPNSTTSTTLAANGSYTIPAGYHDGTGKVTQSLTNRTSSSLTASGATVTAPAGYYASAASKSVATATQATPSISLNNTTGVVTATSTQSAGYVAAGTKTATLELTLNDSTDLTASGATVSVPAGYYAAAASKSVATVTDVSKSLDATYNSTSKTYTNTSYTIPAGYHSGSGKVSITLEEKSATPSTSAQTITPASGKVLSKVTVASIPSDYVPSGYVKPTATLAAKTYTPSTSAQTIAAGTYLSGVQTISAVPTQSKSATPTTSSQTIKPDTGKFLSSVSVEAIATETKTATPKTTSQTITPTSGKYLTKVTVNAIPSTYVPDGYVKPTATKAAATITPGTSNQTIAAGTYCSGAQTIAGDADLVSANIKAGANIFGVAGNANVVDTSAGTATAAQILSGKIAFVDGKKITGTIATLSTDATGSGDGVHHTSEYNPHYGALSTGDTNKYVYTFIPPNNYIGSVNYIRVPEAKVADAVGVDGSKILSGTSILGVAGTISSKAAATYGAKTSAQTIAAGQYLSGAQTIAAVTQTNLTAANIVSGKTVTIASNGSNLWNVAGTFSSDATATAAQILTGKTAYVKGSKVTGTLPTYPDQYNMSQGVTVGNYVAYKIKQGAYTYPSSDGIVYIRSTKEQVATAIGLTADKIVGGNTILGIAGTGVATSQLVAAGMVASGGNGESEANWSCCRPGFVNETYFTRTVESSTISNPTTANRHQVVFTCNKTGTYRFRGHAFAYKGETSDVGLCRSRVVKSGTEKLLVTSTTGDTIDYFDFTESMTSGYTFRIQTDTWGTSKEDDGWLAAVYVTIETA